MARPKWEGLGYGSPKLLVVMTLLAVSQFALEIPHSWAALDLFPGEYQKTATFVFTEIKPSLFFCSSERV